ncbi:peptidyl-tRNA hydrolase [Caldanaerobius fijiensis DSM 17918]|uniref:Peptidyl-tRNA hydrolase n=1 Tax=Caldanaerobius fijiensis DSM 17918 TaxID=1121256 RepID=A0A1M4Z4N6_9THEO|nr:aminoacyl-tRNA hydrolase [Caldanaerobius fijiensis]SHF13011.1 peptidyl-tRNA hydrolase [Caldanaerobius fijiensis DSM 17918]
MYLIVGLGNPGSQYQGTRHNVGFDVVDRLSERWSIPVKDIKYKGLTGKGSYKGEDVILLKPSTYMNESGRSVIDAVRDLALPLSRVIIVYDDVDLDIGRIRVRRKGSAGGHNGMKSIIYHLESEEFPRVRVGIGTPADGCDMIAHVLGHFSSDERRKVDCAIDLACDAIETIIKDSVYEAMNRFNGLQICG